MMVPCANQTAKGLLSYVADHDSTRQPWTTRNPSKILLMEGASKCWVKIMRCKAAGC